MSSICIVKPSNIKQYLTDLYTWNNEDYTFIVLKSVLVNFTEFYCAVEKTCKKTGKIEIFAGMTKVSYYPKATYDFCYKQMDEVVWPNYNNCPESIMKLLTTLVKI